MTDPDFYDLDGDGIIDTMMSLDENSLTYGYDTDHDGIFDTFLQEADNDGDGYAETLTRMMDYDADGNPDYSHSLVDLDMDGDAEMVVTSHSGKPDSDVMSYSEIFIDHDGDHQYDEAYRVENVDSDNDGLADTVRIWTDTDGSGFHGEPELYALEDLTSGFMPDGPEYSPVAASAVGANFDADKAEPDMVSGSPKESMEHWEFQGPTSRCAIYAQKFVIADLTGKDIPVEEMVEVAVENGWFVDDPHNGGTMTLNTDKMLDYYGIEHDMVFDADIDSLEKALNNGEGVIVSIDSNQVWNDKPNDIFSPDTASDHAVQVIGIDRTDPANPMVVLNDSGHPEGCGELVPLEMFENAWSAGDRQMIVCRA
ncbi:MAG: C39 family peptidase [Muribaculaceae bacterium]|nr:C39 family peptidase [Muribaculaceae bacterium]